MIRTKSTKKNSILTDEQKDLDDSWESEPQNRIFKLFSLYSYAKHATVFW